jgi:hypothetical protein
MFFNRDFLVCINKKTGLFFYFCEIIQAMAYEKFIAVMDRKISGCFAAAYHFIMIAFKDMVFPERFD